MSKYQEFVDNKMKELSKEKIILDVGGGERFQKWLAPYRELFSECDYKTMDYDKTTNADIKGDVHAIPLEDGSIDAIICSSVLEHIENPVQAVIEMSRILRKGGKLFVYIPSIYPYHARKGSYPDYWRFFDDTVSILFKDFDSIEFVKLGGYFKALSFFFPMQHKLQFMLGPIADFFDGVFHMDKRTTTAGYYIYAVK